MREKTKLLFASAGGLGLSPFAPGSCGALLGVAIHLAIAYFFPERFRTPLLILAFVAVSTVHYLLTPWAQQYWRDHDPRHFVLDEVAGYLVVPMLFDKGQPWQVALWGYVLFRVLDIIKIPPAKQVDQLMKDAWGVLLDDVVSAFYALLLMHLGYFLFY